MRSLIRELVRVAEVFFPMLVFCLALSTQLLWGSNPTTAAPKMPEETVTKETRSFACLSSKCHPETTLLFEQMIP